MKGNKLKTKFNFTDENLPIVERFENLTSTSNGVSRMLSHLFYNIKSYSELLEDELEDNPAAEKYLEQLQNDVQTANMIIDDLGKGRIMQLPEWEKLELLNFINALIRRHNKISDVKVEVIADTEEEYFIKASAVQLMASLMHLIALCEDGKEEIDLHISIKAINAKETFAHLNTSHLASSQYYAIMISADPTIQPGCFNYVLQSKSRLSQQYYTRDGILAYGSVIRHGGDILAYDKSGENLAIMVLLPAIDSPALKGSSDDELSSAALQGTETILVVDDEDMIWDVLIENLQNLGYTVILAENGRDCVDIYESNPGFVDLVILDMVMPEMNGREAFTELKKIDDNVKVLLSSGYMAEGEAGDLLDAGAMGFLKKPYRMIDLAKKLRELLG